MHPFVHRITFLAGCLLILVGAVFIFKGSTQVASSIGSGISIVGLLISFIQMYFPTPIFTVNNAVMRAQPPGYITNNRSNFASFPSQQLTLTTGDFAFFLACFTSIPVIAFIKIFSYNNSPLFPLLTITFSAIVGIGMNLLLYVIIPENIQHGCLYQSIGSIVFMISFYAFVIYATIHKSHQALTLDFLCACIFSLFIPFVMILLSKVENWKGDTRISVDTGLSIAFLALLVFAELLFLALVLEPHFFMTFNADGSFNERSYNLFAPGADLIFLTATLSLLFGSIRICTETKEIQGSICGAVAVMFGIGLLLFQTTPLSITISAINILIGLVMFLVARSR